MGRWAELCKSDRPLIGVVHVPPLPGAPRYGGDWRAVVDRALADARAYAAGGADALLVENFGDAPFFPLRVPVETATHLTALAVAIRRDIDLPLGINVLRSDGLAAVAVAHASDAAFIRVNVLGGARVTDQGLVSGCAHEVARLRHQLGAERIQILADVDVKHSAPLARRPLDEEVREMLERGGADGVIVTGRATGDAASLAELRQVKDAAEGRPVLVGSGVTAANAASLLPWCDGLIVGSTLKREGRVGNPVDPDRVADLRHAIRRAW